MRKLDENEKRIVEQVKKSFTKVYTKGNNDEELIKLIQLLQRKQGNCYLDLGTGSGYVAFMLSQVENVYVDGLDVVESVVYRNNKVAIEQGNDKVHFYSYDGLNFPMKDNKYDGIIARYSLHHFPDIEYTVSEMSRVLKTNSSIVICDCVRTKEDDVDFINQWMKLLGDGHVEFVDKEKYVKLFGKYGFELTKCYYTMVRCPRKSNKNYLELLEKYEEVAKSYHYSFEGETVWLEEPVMNICFQRGLK